jgi:hypothetical protein
MVSLWTLQSLSLLYLSFLFAEVSGISAGWTQARLPANSIVDIVGAACALSPSTTCAIVGNQVLVIYHNLFKMISFKIFV